MANKIVTFAIANSGTESDEHKGQGHRLVGLVFPTMTSTTVQFDYSPDGSTWTRIYDTAGTPAAVTLGGADTGSKAVAVPDTVGKLSATGFIRLVVASQGAARSVTGIYERFY